MKHFLGIFIILCLHLAVFLNAAGALESEISLDDVLHLDYYGQTIEVKVQFMFPVTLRFDGVVQQIIWDKGLKDFQYQPEIKKETKVNYIVFFANSMNPKPMGAKIIVGNNPSDYEGYSVVLSGSDHSSYKTIHIHDRRKSKNSIEFAKIKSKDLMVNQDTQIYKMLFAHRFGLDMENYNQIIIDKTIEHIGFREIILESIIRDNVFIQVDSYRKEEVGVYSAKFIFCNRADNKTDPITPAMIKEKFPSWMKFSYPFDTIPPSKCMPVYIVMKRDKKNDEYIKN